MTATNSQVFSNRNGKSDTARSSAKPIAVVLTTSEREVVLPGQSHVIGVTVSNQGDQDAIVYLSIDPHNPQMRQWCDRLEQRLALPPGNSGEITFELTINPDTAAGLYKYDLIVDASRHYTEFPVQRYSHRQIQVLPPERSKTEVQDPTFWLDLRTTPSNPHAIQAGESVVLNVVVENRTARVDRMHLSCDGLPPGWSLKLDYPTDMTGTGMMKAADSLGLNPGDTSRIQVMIQSPATALAGTYTPTFRLRSENNPSLGLLDLLYIKVAPIYTLQSQIQAIAAQVKQEPAKFEIQLANFGNTHRQVKLHLQDQSPAGACRYKLLKHEVRLSPRSTQVVSLTGKPLRWWTRPWFGTGKMFSFQVQLEDSQQLAAIHPNTLPGYLTWMPRPWWHLLLAALLGLGTVGSLIWLIWWLFLRPPVLPKVSSFVPEDTRYAAANNDIAQVSWEIENPDRIQAIKLTGYNAEGEATSGPLVFEFKYGQLPAALASSCVIQAKLLTCRNVRTDARKPGQYVFELAVIPKRRQAAITQQTKTVTIAPYPIATVKSITSLQKLYREAGALPAELAKAAPKPLNEDGILLSWQVDYPEDIRELVLIGRDDKGKPIGEMRYEILIHNGQLDLPPDLAGKCKLITGTPDHLVCSNIATQLSQVGQYQFELQAISRQNLEQPTKPTQTDVIQVQPLPSYIARLQVNGEEAAPFYRVPLSLGQLAPIVRLNWDVRGGKTTKVQLLPSPGEVALRSTIDLPLTQEYGTQVVTLQASDLNGKPITRMITFEIFNPSPTDPNLAAAQAGESTARVMSASNAALLKAIQSSQQATQKPSQAAGKAVDSDSSADSRQADDPNQPIPSNQLPRNKGATTPLLPQNEPALSNPRFSP
jgi:hypothetical protein